MAGSIPPARRTSYPHRSIKYQLYQMDTEEILAGGVVERVGSPQAVTKTPSGTSEWKCGVTCKAEPKKHREATRAGLGLQSIEA
jgi:acetate kinase